MGNVNRLYCAAVVLAALTLGACSTGEPFGLSKQTGDEVLADPKHAYMGGEVELVTAPNGAIVSSYFLERVTGSNPGGPRVIKVAEGIWQIAGMSVSWPTIIEGETGLIVYDTGDNVEEGELLYEALRTVSDKPVRAIIYSHSHYTKGAQAMAKGSSDVQVIAHFNLEQNLIESGGLGALYPELTPVLMARTMEQFNQYTPRSGPDAPALATINLRPGGHMTVTTPVKSGDTLVIDGIEMQFITDFHSDTDDCLTVWMPKKKIVLNNLFWPVMPNFYTPRGSLYRDPFNWIAGLEHIRDLEPELLLSTHTGPIKGREEIRRNLMLYRDGLGLVIDQTLRGILKGLGPDELRHFVKLPPHLAEYQNLSQFYGELQWYPPYFYNQALGWWSRDAADLFKLPPAEEARRLVRLMGGKRKVAAEARSAFDASEFAWAAQLATYVLALDDDDEATRTTKADALRAMGHRARGSIARSYYLSQARDLEGEVHIMNVIPPMSDVAARIDSGEYVRRFRVRIDPTRSQDMDLFVKFEIAGPNVPSVGLHLRRGVVEYIDDAEGYYKSPDLAIELTRDEWMELYVKPSQAEHLLKADKVIDNRNELVAFFNLFDDLVG